MTLRNSLLTYLAIPSAIATLFLGCGDDDHRVHAGDAGCGRATCGEVDDDPSDTGDADCSGSVCVEFTDEPGKTDDFHDGASAGADAAGSPVEVSSAVSSDSTGDGDFYTAADGTEGPPSAPHRWRRTSDDVDFASVDVGDGEELELQRMRVSVQVEGLRARTLVDHVYYNPHDRPLEGTFRYPLPTEASVSYYAMFVGMDAGQTPAFFGSDDGLLELSEAERARLVPDMIADNADPEVWGELRVGRIAPPQRVREVFEEISRRQIDPALVEEVAPNSFEARVFPIPAKGYNRVLIAYEQTLPAIGDELRYDFALPVGEIASLEVTVAAAGDEATVISSHGEVELARSDANGIISLEAAFEGNTPGGRVELGFTRNDAHVDLRKCK